MGLGGGVVGDITHNGNSLFVGAESDLELVGLLPELGHCLLVLGDIDLVLVHEILDKDLEQPTVQLYATGPAIKARSENVDLGMRLRFAHSS